MTLPLPQRRIWTPLPSPRLLLRNRPCLPFPYLALRSALPGFGSCPLPYGLPFPSCPHALLTRCTPPPPTRYGSYLTPLVTFTFLYLLPLPAGPPFAVTATTFVRALHTPHLPRCLPRITWLLYRHLRSVPACTFLLPGCLHCRVAYCRFGDAIACPTFAWCLPPWIYLPWFTFGVCLACLTGLHLPWTLHTGPYALPVPSLGSLPWFAHV